MKISYTRAHSSAIGAAIVVLVAALSASGCKSACEQYEAKACESKNQQLCKEAKTKISKWGSESDEKCQKGLVQIEAILAFEKDDGGMDSSTPALDELPGLEEGAKILDADPKNLDKLPK